MSIALSFRTEEATKQQLDACAEALGRNRNWVINDAVESYLEEQRWQSERIQKARASTKTYSTEEVRAHLKAKRAKHLRK